MSPTPLTGDGTGLKWYKSSYSSPDGAACIEVASARGTVRVRDSKHIPGPRPAFEP
ncbi:DUF397 domain-containing protein [Streptomyces hirsutus]|uniref:DUF397 domain-containing protein n=1 Tax=Streptomyces hirsutus TaxID=35620 RepID=UPI0036A989B1